MKVYFKIVVFSVLVSTFSVNAVAQTFDDLEARLIVGVKYKFDNGLRLSANYEHRLDDNLRHYKKSIPAAKVSYDIDVSNHLKFAPAFEYRLETGDIHTVNDLRYSGGLSYKISENLKFNYTPILQQLLVNNRTPEFYLRNGIELNYSLNESLSFSIFSENYQEFDSGMKFSAQKSGVGATYLVNKKNEIQLKIKSKQYSNHKDILRIYVAYYYIIK